jgi:transposase-like protein
MAKAKAKTFTRAEAILAEVTGDKTTAEVARAHDLPAQMLYAWRQAKKISRKGKRKTKRKAGKKATTRRAAEHIDTPPEVAASLDTALRQIEQAGKTIAAIRKAARQVFGV